MDYLQGMFDKELGNPKNSKILKLAKIVNKLKMFNTLREKCENGLKFKTLVNFSSNY